MLSLNFSVHLPCQPAVLLVYLIPFIRDPINYLMGCELTLEYLDGTKPRHIPFFLSHCPSMFAFPWNTHFLFASELIGHSLESKKILKNKTGDLFSFTVPVLSEYIYVRSFLCSHDLQWKNTWNIFEISNSEVLLPWKHATSWNPARISIHRISAFSRMYCMGLPIFQKYDTEGWRQFCRILCCVRVTECFQSCYAF